MMGSAFIGLIAAAPLGAAAGEVKVGAILSAEGIFSSLGGPERQGIELAVAELNAAGGVAGKQFEIQIYDDGGDQAKAGQLANRLIFQDQVSAVFGPSITPTAEIVAPILEQNGVLMIGFVAQNYLWRDTQNVFMSLPSDRINAEAMVGHARENGAKNIAVAFSNVPYGVSGNKFISEVAAEQGLTVVASEKWGETDFDFTSQAGRLKEAKPDAILIWGSCAAADGQLIKALGEAGIGATLVGNLCIPSPQTAEIAGKSAEGAVSFSVIDYAKPDAETKAFIDAYKAKFGKIPVPFAATSYDAVKLWAKAVERAGGKTDSKAVAKAMIGLSHKGVSGQFNTTADDHVGLAREAYKPIVLKGGAWVSP
jgi:branched-chain amino acid transport system substrate-binding protein